MATSSLSAALRRSVRLYSRRCLDQLGAELLLQLLRDAQLHDVRRLELPEHDGVRQCAVLDHAFEFHLVHALALDEVHANSHLVRVLGSVDQS